VIIAMVIKK